jgi:hypothetical protein
MFTIIEDKIYYITTKGLVEYVFSKGKLNKTKNVIELPKTLSEVFTFDEIRRKFITKINSLVEESEVEEEKPKASKTSVKVKEEE